ncbi:UDP-3-O-(3-hydroxymyristoyl)glucosamine N-acyltransferase [Lutimonas halocynthiae]|uniref:UDP-3-O-(3-hydroxymyristoyl)glucosamine N-acyltransferase n=1 Tax=Lutimonas halocynthiae TaxID=1446477 RepID=UPI0025B51E89|nr:UDP-3-O-(3-hydroxymyristoyl)glucosamine N-acyltransferase [Lutimonas halocynthiae]MDN3644124.1 UDP-3-O-(3-hydroxymyristoyl)glucosamine N-acyltransferase [Lutimonas halocynthiae]
MKFSRTYGLQEIAKIIDVSFVGDEKFPVEGMNEIHVVEPGDIVFVDHPKYYSKALESAATIILINKEVACPEGKALLISEDPFSDFNRLSNHFRAFRAASESVSSSSSIGENTVIQPNVFIGNHVKIGDNCLIHPNVTIYDHCVIGNNVIIHAGTVLGSDGFYFQKRPHGFDKLNSVGRVIIEDHVEIGAACTIDKGVTGDTTIGWGSKLDNQVQIAHDTVIGKNCLIASQVGIAGCNVIEDEVIIWGQVGIKSGLRIGKGAEVYAQSGIGMDLEPGKAYFGSPAIEARDKFREMAMIRSLPKLIEKIKK